VKILILKPSSLGDVIQALPVLRLLKLHWREARIFWWIESGLAPLLEGDPDLAGLVRFERKRWGKLRHWPERFRSVQGLRRQEFDLVIDLQCLARSAIFAWLARGKQLVGLDEIREGARGFYDFAVPRKSFHTHAVDWYLAVLPRVGVPVHNQFVWLPPRPAVAEAVHRKWPEARRWIALQPGARWLNKRWPVEHFAQLAQMITRHHPETGLVILGDKGDRLLGDIIADAAPDHCLNLCGATSLPEMVEWIRRCELMVTNDTGPMHAAAAMSKPLIALFGPTEPRRTGPYGQLDHVLRLELPCSPCLKPRCRFEKPEECLRALLPAQVAAHIGRTLSRNHNVA
jgi:heptosyltransferase-1